MVDWPAELRGITESIVTTKLEDDTWNVAALGLVAGDPVTARTWGDTRTRRRFHREGGGYVQFSGDPVAFVDAALSVWEVEESLLPSADAWVEVAVERVDGGESGGTHWEEWALRPIEVAVEHEDLITINRGFNAVVEATVAASRLDVDSYDTDELHDRLDYFESVAHRCGGHRERLAFDRLREFVER